MRTRLQKVAAGGALGLTVLAGGAVVVPAVASAAVSPQTDAATEIADRVTRIQQALAGLVSDGTIDQQQADAVAQARRQRLRRARSRSRSRPRTRRPRSVRRPGRRRDGARDD